MTEFTKEQFLDTQDPYEELYQYINSPFELEIQQTIMAEQAKDVGVSNFKKLFAAYCRNAKQVSRESIAVNRTFFSGQPIQLDSGKWEADDMGVTTRFFGNEQQACCHPILPVERLVNVDTGIEKLKLAFAKGGRWRTVIADKKTLASATGILALADQGIAVNSENARYLVMYLHDLENSNYDKIPEKKSVNRLGWIDGHGFSPFVDNLIFDGEHNYKPLFESVTTKGDFGEWLETAREIRQGSLTARITLAASFASVLVKPCGCLPFFVHLWGTESGTGKTVALMAAASVWANPDLGKYIQTFNSTSVGREKLAAFCNSMPLIIDELQLSPDRQHKQGFDVYSLAEGVGRTRGNKGGGVEKTSVWANCMITSGESPITQNNAGAGALNRVIEVECKGDDVVIQNGQRIANRVRMSFGHAGKMFVEKLDSAEIKHAQDLFNMLYRNLSMSEVTEKQAMAAALILTADQLATDWIFSDSRQLTIPEIQSFLMTKNQVSANIRAYEFVCDWIRQNKNRFDPNTSNEYYGEIRNGRAYIIPTVFTRTVDNEGYSSRGFLSWLKSQNLIETDSKHMTIKKVIGGTRDRFISLLLPDNDPGFNW